MTTISTTTRTTTPTETPTAAPVSFLDLAGQYRTIRPEIDAAVARVLESGRYVLGEEVEGFEQDFASCCGVKHGIAVNSGTSALHLALLAAGVGPGDEVITVPFTFVATVAAVCYSGATPVLIDVKEDSLTMDPDRIEGALTSRTRAILPVHLHGQAADMDAILSIARRHGLVVIEDAAQAHGGRYKGRPVGSLGDMACFSFYPGKNLGACGEGGIVVTDNDRYRSTMQMQRDWGQSEKYNHILTGYNYRMDSLQGAILRVKLSYLAEWTRARRKNAARYDELLEDTPVKTPHEMEYAEHVYHVYSLQARDRDLIMEGLRRRNIQTSIHYPIPVHLQPAFEHLGYRAGDFPVSESLARTVLSLPMYPELDEERLLRVAECVRQCLPDGHPERTV